MDANVLSLFFLSLLKLSSSFALAAASSDDQDGGVTEFPFSQAKIKYHRSRYCITAFGETNCVRMDESPGDAAKIAKLYRIWMQGYEPNPDRILRTILQVHRNIKKNKLRQGKPSQKTKQAVLNHIVKQNKLSQRTKAGKFSQSIKLGKLIQRTNQDKLSQPVKHGKVTQRTNQAKLSQPLKQSKLSQNTKQTKLRHLSNLSQKTKQPKLNQPVKQGGLKENRVVWNVAGHHNHVAPIPRLLEI